MCVTRQQRHSWFFNSIRSSSYICLSWAASTGFVLLCYCVWNLHLKLIICCCGKEAILNINYTLKRWLFLKVWAEEQHQHQLDHRIVSVSKLVRRAAVSLEFEKRERDNILFLAAYLLVCAIRMYFLFVQFFFIWWLASLSTAISRFKIYTSGSNLSACLSISSVSIYICSFNDEFNCEQINGLMSVLHLHTQITKLPPNFISTNNCYEIKLSVLYLVHRFWSEFCKCASSKESYLLLLFINVHINLLHQILSSSSIARY